METTEWYKDIFRSLFGMLDGVIYGLIGTAYDLLTEISHFRAFGDSTLKEFSTRVYAIIGIVMLFKLSFSFINYMINPDAFTDKQKGVQNVVKNIIIMFVMLILSPWIFEKLWQIQGVILEENVLANLIFGDIDSESGIKYNEFCSDEYVISSSRENAGEFMSKMVLRGFYRPDETLSSTDGYKDMKTKICQKSTSSVKALLSSDIYNATTKLGDTKYYVMEYKFAISTVVGVVTLLLMVNFCIDVGTRVVKLSFLQLIAPIPIISYIDPASGKNGMFTKWLKEVGKSWVSIFIRLVAIFFAISIIQHIGVLEDITGQNKTAGIWVQIFVVIGALIFAKQLPDLIQNITGIKMEGGFNLNPFKKIENEALLGKQAMGALTGVTNAALSGVGQMSANGYNFFKTRSNLAKAIKNSENDKEKQAQLQRQMKKMHIGRFMGTTTGGLLGGTMRGVRTGYNSGKQGKYNVFANAKSDLEQGNRIRDNRANIKKYNDEVKYRRKEAISEFLSDHGVDKKRKLSSDDRKALKKQMKVYKEQRYGFFERNIGERLDRWAGVKNEYGGVGYYDKQISDLEKSLGNNEAKETAMRHAFSNYCANNNIDEIMIGKFHKQHHAKAADIDEMAQQQIKAELTNRYNAKAAQVSQTRYNEKLSNEGQNRFNEKITQEGQTRINNKIIQNGATRYVEKEQAEFNKRRKQKMDDEFNDRYHQMKSEEYDRIIKENGGETFTEEQLKQFEQFKEKAKEKLMQDIDREVKKELQIEVENEIKQEVENEIKQEVENEIKQEVEKDIREEVESEIRQEVKREELKDIYKELEEQYGISAEEVDEMYEKVKNSLENVSIVDEENKEIRKKMKEFKNLVEARQSAEKK